MATLQEHFRKPPEDSKLMMRWWWFGPAVTAEELNREMRLMKQAGIGGFEIQPVYPLTLDDPGKGLVNLRYLSPEFLEAVRSTAHTAQQLDLRMDMTLGSGWPFGGPHITPELAAQHLRCLRLPVKKGSQRIQAPQLGESERFLAAFIASGDARHFDASSLREITSPEKGVFVLPSSPPGPRVLLVLVAGLTGMNVKRAAVGAEGLVLDHYRRAALEKHLEAVGEPLIEAGAGRIRAVFCDSLEVVGADWTADFLEEFRRRRGYDLKPHLPALVGDAGSLAAAIRHDWGQTLTELFNENLMQPLQEWCHRHHVQCRVQAYGEPPAGLSSYRFVDLPEGEQGEEGSRWNSFTPARWASSAGHHYGAPVVSAETWTWIHSLAFRATPLDLKAAADEQFLEGINQLVGHGWPYSPASLPEPGWFFYAAGALNQHNPWWPAMPELALYLQRVSFMLRQGRPANDVAVYLPTHDAWAHFTLGHVDLWEATRLRLGPAILPSLLEAGYNVDFVDDEVLANLGHIDGGKLVIADQAFPVVILPGIERIPPSTLTKFEEFARCGGILIATRRLPSLAPGFVNQETESSTVARQVAELFKSPSAPGHFISSEDSLLGQELSRLYPPDVALSLPTRNIGFVHRRSGSTDIYFVANASNQWMRTTATFRIKGKHPEWWNPFTGEVTTADVLPSSGQGTVVQLDLEPYGSRLLVFGDRAAPSESVPPQPAHLPEPLDVSHGWEVTLEGAGRKIFMDALCSWTELDGLRFFSGQATYQNKGAIPNGFLQEGIQVALNLGEPVPIPVKEGARFQAWIASPVREAADVYVNGRRVGVIWRPPYELDVRPFLRSGENELRIVVGNLAVNEMAGRPQPDFAEVNARYGQRFTVQGWELVQPIPSGLTGPIRLIARSKPAAARADP